MILLQTAFDFFAEPDPTADWVIWVVGGVVLGVILIGGIVNKLRGGSGGKGVSRFAFRRKASDLGLSPDEAKLLLKLAKSSRVGRPMQLLTNPEYYESVLKRLVQEIEESDLPEREQESRKHVLFSIANKVDTGALPLSTLPSTKNLRAGTEIRVSSDKDEVLKTHVDARLADGLVVRVPYPGRGVPFGWKKGRRLNVTFIVDETRVFAFQTRLLGYTEAAGERTIVLEHATDIRQVQKRRSPRREMNSPAYFYPVQIVSSGKGRKAQKQAMVDRNRRALGKILDVSGGGCALQASVPLAAGAYLKLEFRSHQGQDISALGKVVYAERRPPRGGVMHVRFTRMSRKNLNDIESYVFGTAEER